MSCSDIYNDERSKFEGILYFSAFSYLLLNVALLPKNEERERQRRQRLCSCLAPCLRGMAFCFESCRPLLEDDESAVTAAANDVGTSGSVGFILLFLLVQTVPIVALIVGIGFFYPDCPCPDTEYCQCILRINFIPVGSCTGAAIFFTSVIGLASLAFMAKGIRALGVIRSAASYATLDRSEQELV